MEKKPLLLNFIAQKERYRDFFRAMKITLFLLFVCMLPVTAINMEAQNATITVKNNPLSIGQLISEIEKQTEYLVVYSNREIDINREVRVKNKSDKVGNLLSEVFAGTNIRYEFLKDYILLSSKDNKETDQQQDPVISGVVTDVNGEPIIGANVSALNKSIGTITDINGNFTLNVALGSTLQISFIGYVTQDIKVTNRVLNIQLVEDAQSLDEVIVVGYGTQKKVNLTGAVTSVSMKDMTKRQVGQTGMALQGLIPGVTVVQRSGQPGADGGTLTIRGLTTLNNNSALVLVDGIEMNINNVDPSLIENISVLKDASSASIYGSRAANGVILVTTKRAANEKISFSYNGYVSHQSPTKMPDFVNAVDHMKMLNQAQINVGKSPDYSEEYIQEYIKNGPSDRDKYPDTNWQDAVLTGNGLMQSHFLTMSGGSERARTMISLGYLNQNGLIENSNFKRYTFRSNTDLQLLKQLSARVDAQVWYTNQTQPSRGNESFYWMNVTPATHTYRYSNGNWAEAWNGENPVAFNKDGGLSRNLSPAATLSFDLNFKPFSWLTVEGKYGLKYWETHQSLYNKVVQTYKYDGSPGRTSPQIGKLRESTNRSYQDVLTLMFTAEKNFGIHNLKLTGGFQQESITSNYHDGTRENYVFPDYPVLDAGGAENQKNSGSKSKWALQSYFGRINYNIMGKYLFEVNARYDGSSRFAKGHKWGLFPSFSLGWRISEEKFWESIKPYVNNLKVRGSWGQLGNQSGDNYAFASMINMAPKYMFDKQINSGAALVDLANSEITWETTTITNIGLDIDLFSKLSVNFDWYYKKTKDILLRLNIPLVMGLNAPMQNAGEVENRGWEFGLTYVDKIGNVSYRISGNLSDVRNKILDLKGISSSNLTVNNEGYPMNSLFGLQAIGYIQPEDYDSDGKYKYASQYGKFGPGDIKYKNQNDDNVINANDYVIIGNTLPRYVYGLNLDLEYKGFDFSMFLQGVGKVDGYLNGPATMAFQSPGTAQEQHKNYWTEENRNAKFPRLTFSETNNQQNSSFWMKSAAYLRLKNIQLGYSLPQSLLKGTFLGSVRLYVTGSNLLTFSDFWDGYDVEAPVGNGQYYPQTKTISVGVDVRF